MPGRWAGLSLVALAIGAYLPALAGGFVWDDVVIMREAVIHAPGGIVDIWLASGKIEREGHYWPILYTSFWIEHKLWGLEPFGYHAANVALHALVTWLAWQSLARGAMRGAWLAGALFAVHPVHAEAVAWIMGRKDLLAAAFALGAFQLWLRFEARPRTRTWIGCAGLYLAAMLSKSIAVTFPVMIVLWAWWQRGRVTLHEAQRVVVLCGIGAGVATADYLYYRSMETVSFGWSMTERIINAAGSLWFYAMKLAWPAGLAPVYARGRWEGSDPVGWALLAGVVAVILMSWAGRRWWGRGPVAAILFFALTLSPTLGLVDFGYLRFSAVADRFQYMASLGLIALAAGAATSIRHRLSWPRGRWTTASAGPACAMAVLAALGALTWQKTLVYEDQVTFFTHVLERNPQAFEARFNLGRALSEAGRLEESVAVHLEAARVQRNDPRHLHQAGEGFRKLGRYSEARDAYERALEVAPEYPRAKGGLGLALMELGENENALRWLEEATHQAPELGQALYPAIGRANAELGRLEEAARAYRLGIRSAPEKATLHANLGIVLVALANYEEGIESLDRALALDPSLDAARVAKARAKRLWNEP